MNDKILFLHQTNSNSCRQKEAVDLSVSEYKDGALGSFCQFTLLAARAVFYEVMVLVGFI